MTIGIFSYSFLSLKNWVKKWSFGHFFCFVLVFWGFFLAKFSFTNTHDSQVSRGRERVFIFVECVVLTSNCVSAMGNNLDFVFISFVLIISDTSIRANFFLFWGHFVVVVFLLIGDFFRLSCFVNVSHVKAVRFGCIFPCRVLV